MGIFAWIVTGLIAGSLAQRITGYEKEGCLRTMLLGVLGGLLGGWLSVALFQGESATKFGLRGIALAFVGAVLICLVAGGIFGKRKR